LKVEHFANKRDTNKPPNAIQQQNLGMDLTNSQFKNQNHSSKGQCAQIIETPTWGNVHF
jgi:hypothetical protein